MTNDRNSNEAAEIAMDMAAASASWILTLVLTDYFMGGNTLTWVADTLGLEDMTQTDTRTIVDTYTVTKETKTNLAEDIVPGIVATIVAAIIYFGSRAVRGYSDGKKKKD